MNGLPNDVWLLPAYRIRTSTLNLQATDNYAAPYILVEEYIVPQGALA